MSSKTKSFALSAAVRECLASASIYANGSAWDVRLHGHLSRKDYEQFKVILAGLRGEWIRKEEIHRCLYDPTQAIHQIVETGVVPEYIFNPHSFFPTPEEVITDLLFWADLTTERYAQPDSEHSILEPSCGDGRICRRLFDLMPNAKIDAFEIDERNWEIAEANGVNLIGKDFLVEGPELTKTYDFVVMNPPFNKKEYQQHIKLAYGYLKPGGILSAIVPAGWVNDKEFRNWVFMQDGQWEDIGSPFETTNVKCSIINMTKTEIRPLVEPDNCGFGSSYHAAIQIALDSDYLFYQSIKDVDPQSPRFASCVESAVERLITKENCSFYFDDIIMQQVVEYCRSGDDYPCYEHLMESEPKQLALLA